MSNLQQFTTEQSELDLLIWDRFNSSDHITMLEFLRDIVGGHSSETLLVMLHPIGSTHQLYQQYRSEFTSCDVARLHQVPLLNGRNTRHCEVWLQTIDSGIDLGGKLVAACSRTTTGCWFVNHPNRAWWPLGKDFASSEYAWARGGKETKALLLMGEPNVPWFMKLLWHSSTEVIFRHWQRGSSMLNPSTELSRLRQIMNDIFQEKDLADTGLSTGSYVIDPTRYGVSHLSAFAVNTIVEIQQNAIHQIEQYLGDGTTTQPFGLPSKSDFLSLFQ